MGRSLKKGPYVDAKLFAKIDQLNDSGIKEPVTTWARACTIIPEFVGHTFMVHNGKTHLKVFVTEDMVGHRLGEFAPTRSFRGHGGKAKEKPKRRRCGGGRLASWWIRAKPWHTQQYIRHARISARKVRPLADLIRGKRSTMRWRSCATSRSAVRGCWRS